MTRPPRPDRRQHPRRDYFMTHLAMWEGLAESQSGEEVEWGALVTDEEYGVGQ